MFDIIFKLIQSIRSPLKALKERPNGKRVHGVKGIHPSTHTGGKQVTH